jgi:uncharacterized protein YecE (DUF72 family)
MPSRIFVATAGWSIPRASAHRFPPDGTHLQRYARILNGTEINSSFYRPHTGTTYARWGASTPRQFRFAVKVPRAITHERELRDVRAPLIAFLDETSGLGARRGPLLVQLPPSHVFDGRAATRFFALLRFLYPGPIVCEPRHPTWFSARAGVLLARHQVARVAADPPPALGADRPGGWDGLAYFRLHGSPRRYWSAYDAAYLAALATTVHEIGRFVDVWCVFDNTASGAALENAFRLQQQLNVR